MGVVDEPCAVGGVKRTFRFCDTVGGATWKSKAALEAFGVINGKDRDLG
jgi:hypothetical protein